MWYHLQVQYQLALFSPAHAFLCVPQAHLILVFQQAFYDPCKRLQGLWLHRGQSLD